MLLSSEQLTHLKECESNPEFSKYINRPLSGLFETIKIHDIRDGIKIGLILCHGHNYPNDYHRRLKFVNYWYMVDISEECFPDYICDLYSSKQLEYFPDKIFDYILDVNCRIERFPVYDLCKRLLKTTGYIITINHFDQLGTYLDDHTLGKINKKLIGNDPDIIKYLNNFFDKEAWLKPHLEHMTDNQLTYFILNFGGYASGKNENIKQLNKKYSAKILKKHGYQYIKHFGPFVSKPPPFGMSYLFFKPDPDAIKNISQQNHIESETEYDNYLSHETIILIKERIQFLTHHTSLNSFFEIIKSGFLIPINFDVVMMSIFPVVNYSGHLPFEGHILMTKMHDNFNISLCFTYSEEPAIVLLFNPKLLWINHNYYFSPCDNYGMPSADGFPNVSIKDVLDNLGFWGCMWPEIGFYEPIDVVKYIVGIVIPKKYMHNEKLKSIIDKLGIRIFICSETDIYETNHL